MKYAAFADLTEGMVHIIGFDPKDLRSREDQWLLYPGDIKEHHVFMGSSAEIKMYVSTFVLEKDDEIKNTYEEAQRDLIHYIFTQD
jgi:hypothetical protein